MPRFDGDPIFNALLDTSDKGSEFAIEIEDFSHAQQWYEPNTAVLRTQLVDHRGQAVEITDFAPRFLERSRYFRPVMLVRRLRPIHGAPRVRVGLNRGLIGDVSSRPSRRAATTCDLSGRCRHCASLPTRHCRTCCQDNPLY